jgi:hypothetical protein
VESGVSRKMDASASSQFQPSGDYYSATNPSGFVDSSYVASSISGKMDSLIPWSALGYSGDTQVITGISGSAIGGVGGGGDVYMSSFGYNGTAISAIEGSSLYDYSAHARISTVAGRVSSISSQLSSKVDTSAMSGYVPVSAVSAWSSQIESLSAALSAIQTAMANVYTLSAGSGIQISSNTSTKVTVVQLS